MEKCADKMKVKNSKQLYNKLLFIYTGVLVSVVFALVFYFMHNTRNRIRNTNLEYMHMMSEEAAGYLEDCQGIAGFLHKDLYKSSMEMDDLLHYFNDAPEDYQKYRLNIYSDYHSQNYKGIEDFVNEAFEAYNSIKRITLISYMNSDITFFTGNQNVYHAADKKRDVFVRIKYENLADEGEFSFLKEIRDPASMQSMGCMIVTFDAEKFSRLKEYYSEPEIMVYNDAGTVIFDSDGAYEQWEIENARAEGILEEMLNAYAETSESENYHAVVYLGKSKAAVLPVPVILMISVMGIIMIMIGEMLVQLYLKRLSGRLNCILDGMTTVYGGDLNVRLRVNKNGDELDVISEHFNEMCEKLDLYIRKSYLAEIEQKNAEMAALQSQINPHFLYNTLEAIRMKAICNGDREVGKMLYSMAVIFRSQIKEADVITMAQELHYCKKYLELFEYRYQNQFRAEVECPEEFVNVPIIKFVLQPIIENYFIHGMRMGQADNLIRIFVERSEEDFRIIVEDNGHGMTEDEILKMNGQLRANEMDNTKSIGVANVNRRVKAVYGNQYGVQMEAKEEGGLRVILCFKPDEENES